VSEHKNEIIGNFQRNVATLELYTQHKSQYEQWETL